jgi:hypothetical protein
MDPQQAVPGQLPLPHTWVQGLMSKTEKGLLTESTFADKRKADSHFQWLDMLAFTPAGRQGPQEELTGVHFHSPSS